MWSGACPGVKTARSRAPSVSTTSPSSISSSLPSARSSGWDRSFESTALPGPGPAAGCCHYDDASCAPGLVCCKEDCDKEPRQCSYTQWACGGRYGRKHHCEWHQQGATEGELEGGGVCVVGSGGEAGSSAAEDGAAVAEDGRVVTAVEMVVTA